MVVVGLIFINQPKFGKNPSGERLARVEKSTNYKDGKFQNLSETPQITSDKSFVGLMWDFLFVKKTNLRPETEIPSIKTDLNAFPKEENVLVWLGHSAYFMQIEGKRFLVDPTLVSASPVGFFNKAFKGADIYTPDDIPAIDYLIITHDHWDHLDYETVIQIKDRVGHIVTALGVGEHLEYWGIPAEKITELDWYEVAQVDSKFKFTALPVRHFSGRGLSPKKTLWASFMLETPSQTIYLGGDSGYDDFYQKTAAQFPNIDWAILENGQYDKSWKHIHFHPEEFPELVKTLQPKNVLAFHNSKYALANHPWYEPLEKAYQSAKKHKINLLTPKIGEVVYLTKENQPFGKWWEGVK